MPMTMQTHRRVKQSGRVVHLAQYKWRSHERSCASVRSFKKPSFYWNDAKEETLTTFTPMSFTTTEEELQEDWFQNIVDPLNYYVIRSEGYCGFALMIFIRFMEIWSCIQFVIDVEWTANFGVEGQRRTWAWTSFVFFIVFSVDYACRVIGSYGYKSYVSSFMGIVDLLVVISSFGDVLYLLGIANTLPDGVPEGLRLLRLARLANLLKIQDHMGEPGQCQALCCSEMGKVVFSMFILIFASAALFLSFEDLREEFVNPYENIFGNTDRLSWFNAFYYASTTIMAVGYGDIVPETVSSRIVCTAIQLIAYGLISYNITRLLDAFTEANRLQHEKDMETANVLLGEIPDEHLEESIHDDDDNDDDDGE